jgi:hypothetical protein
MKTTSRDLVWAAFESPRGVDHATGGITANIRAQYYGLEGREGEVKAGKSFRKDSGRRGSERFTQRVEAVSLGAEKWHGRGCRHADRYIRTNE